MTAICFFSGGTGTPKLLRGYKNITNDFCVVVNVAEDVWVSGNKVCPDIDSVIYALSDLIDDEKWWGVKDDTFTTHEMLKKLGFTETLKIGDIDRAIHILRSELLRAGYNLTETTDILRKRLGIEAKVFPACNEEIQSYIKTPKGWLHFQEFWIKYRGKIKAEEVRFDGIEKARIPKEVKEELRACKAVVIGPSNPITSITPILKIRGYLELLKEKYVVAISPIIGTKAVSGPAVNLMKASGFSPTPQGVVDCYREFLDAIVVHEGDKNQICEDVDVKVFETNILMKSREDEVRLAKFIQSILILTLS